MSNKEKFDYLGITKFQQAGYLGQDITFASREGLSEHGKKVLDVMKQICPKANILYKQDYNKKPRNIDVYTTSYFQNSDSFGGHIDNARALYDAGTFLVCAVGNDNDEKVTELSKHIHWTSIGACNLTNGKVTRMYYSSQSMDLDFMSLTNMETDLGIFTGTSCAAPVFASMCVLVQSFFKQKVGRKLSNSELIDFIMDNTKDLGKEGFDELNGNGIFILPNPEEIDIKKYMHLEKIIKLQLYNNIAQVDDKYVELDTDPILYKNRTMVPIRFIAEAFGAEVNWDQEKKVVTIIF